MPHSYQYAHCDHNCTYYSGTDQMHEMDYSILYDAQGSGKEDKGEFDEYAILLSEGGSRNHSALFQQQRRRTQMQKWQS